jgi:hypothetical protein
MVLETVIGLALLSIDVIGYLCYRLLSNVNWPLFWFYVKGGMN